MTAEERAELGTILAEASEVFAPRDYRKECWIAAYSASIARGAFHDLAQTTATLAVQLFDETFPA